MTKELLEYISSLFPEGKLKRYLKRIYFRYLNNKWYRLNKIIKKTKILEDGLIYIELKNGLKFYDNKSRDNHLKEEEAYKWAIKKNVSNIKEPENYKQIYIRIYNEFILNQHLNEFSLDKEDIVVDAGANIGGFTIKAADIVGSEGMVIAIEPEKENLKILEKNIKANNLENVLIISRGLWSHKGIKSLYLDDWPGLHSLFGEKPGSSSQHPDKYSEKQKHSNRIEVDTLDNLMDELGIDKINFVKMDIEGAEIEALKGAEKMLTNKNLKLVIEANHIINGEPTYKTIAPWLRKKGFKIVRINKKMQGTTYAKFNTVQK